MNPLLNTFIFFSLMRRYVTMAQLSRMHAMSLRDVKKWLEKEKNVLRLQQGEYGLKESENIMSCVSREEVKKRFDFAVRLAKYNPFIQGIALANSWTFDASKKTSDVDVVIVCKKNRLYITRLLYVLPLKILQLRPKETTFMPICASFFIDEDEDISSVMLSNSDVYFVYWTSNLFCVGNEAVWNKVLSVMKKKLLPWSLQMPIVQESMKYTRIHAFLHVITRIWADNRFTEYIAYRLQRWYLPSELTQNSVGVTITRTIFKAHTDDKREILINKFDALCQKYSNDISHTVQE